MFVVVDYDSARPLAFEALRLPVSAALQKIAVSIEHVGSAAVPGLAAKPVIDMEIAVSREYGALKKRLMAEFSNDMDGYVEGKTAFIVGILARAGLARGAIDDIEKMNRRPGCD